MDIILLCCAPCAVIYPRAKWVKHSHSVMVVFHTDIVLDYMTAQESSRELGSNMEYILIQFFMCLVLEGLSKYHQTIS